MKNIQTSEKLQDLVDKKNTEQLYNLAEISCTNGYDNDGSTGYEVFKNGFDLASTDGKEEVLGWDSYAPTNELLDELLSELRLSELTVSLRISRRDKCLLTRC